MEFRESDHPNSNGSVANVFVLFNLLKSKMMLSTKLDIFKNEWLEVVFAGRNQSYGAYDLRKTSDAFTTKALFIGVSIFVLAICSPLIMDLFASGNEVVTIDKYDETVVIIAEKQPIEESDPLPPLPVEPPPSKVDQVRMPPPVVVAADKVTDVEPPTAKELEVANPGPKTTAGDPNAEIRIDMPVGNGTNDQEVTESLGESHIFVNVEIQPSPPDGMEGFLKYIGKTYRYPAQAESQGVSGRVVLTFVVERDGSLTDIKIIRNLGYGTGEEAINVLKKAKKWSPGIQNGRPVRVQYTLPIVLNLAN